MGGFGSTSRQFSEQVGNKVMIKFVRLAALAAIATAVATPAFAQTAANANSTVRITKPLILNRTAHMDFGLVTVWGDGTATMDQAGALNCIAATLVCALSGTPATFTIQGTNNRTVDISASASVALQSAGAPDLTLVTDYPDTQVLNSSGVGNTTSFGIGGSIDLLETTPDGTYTGTINVTVSYL
jgi:hypothetical protein